MLEMAKFVQSYSERKKAIKGKKERKKDRIETGGRRTVLVGNMLMSCATLTCNSHHIT